MNILRHAMKLLQVAMFASVLFTPSLAFAQTATSQSSSGTINSFSVNAQSTFSVNTSATSTPGVTAKSEANLVLSPNSSLTTGVNCLINCSGTFEQTTSTGSNSSTLNTNGSSSLQAIYIDPSSTFSTYVDTSTSTESNTQNSGSASAGITANTSLTVTEQRTQFVNTLTNVFQ
jgi:hypothetical protein